MREIAGGPVIVLVHGYSHTEMFKNVIKNRETDQRLD